MFDIVMMSSAEAAWLEEAFRSEVERVWALTQDGQESPRDPGLSDLRDLEPGIRLAAALAGIDVGSLSGHDRVIVMAAHQRLASHHQAHLYSAMASVADAVVDTLRDDGETDPELAEAACASEIRAALRLTRRAADSELAIARSFQSRLPEVWAAFSEGRIDRRRANLIVHRTDHLSPGLAREVSRQALTNAPELTAGQLTAYLKKLCAETDPGEAKDRFEAAVGDRRLVLEAGVDGTAHLYLLDLAPDRAMRVRDRIDSIARALRAEGESRTMDQLRADVALDLLDPTDVARSAHRRGALVMTVDLATLAGLAEHSGDLGGFGPVVADIARQVAEDSVAEEWRFVVADSAGRPVSVGTTARRPTRQQRRLVETLYPTCVFPGCRIPAAQCDLDHRTPWAEGGPTSTANLAPLCRHDHRMRHRAGWSYRRAAHGGHEWVSPLGHRYTSNARSP